MLSMSSGLMSAMRFALLSSVFGSTPPSASVNALLPLGMYSLLTITPSMMYSGFALALMDVIPRICTCMPPPGAPPLLAVITAPGILPWTEFSIVGAGVSSIAAELTALTALAAFCDDTVVATPVTTSASRRRTSRCRAMVYSVLPGAIGIVCAR